MKALTLSPATIRPLASPTATDRARVARTASSTPPDCMVWAATSVPRLIRYATDRSSEPVRMTIDWPTATRPRATLF